MFETVKQFLRKGTSGFRSPQPWLKDALGIQDTYAGVDVTPEGALAVSAVCACIRLLSESVASLPLFVYRHTETSKQKASEHPSYGCLHDSPNDYQTSYTWRAQAMAHVLGWGNAYSVIERDAAGAVRRLWPLLPESVTVRTDGGQITYEYHRGAIKQVFPFEDVLHFRGPTLNGVTGMSIIGVARQGIALAMTTERFGASFFKNGARMSGVLQVDGKVKDGDAESFNEKYSGASNAGKVLVIGGGSKFVSTSIPPEDAQFLQGRQFSIQEIARFFRVSPALIGDLSRSTYSNSEQEQLSFLVHTLRPWLCNFEAEMNLKLFPARTQFFCEFDMAALQRADQATRYEAYSKGLAAGFLTVADVRRWENLPELPGTDQLNRPANMVPATEGVPNVEQRPAA